MERYVKEPEDGSVIGNITYSAEEARIDGQELINRIRGSRKLQDRWGIEGLDDLQLSYCSVLDEYVPKGGDIELIVTSRRNNTKPRHVFTGFDLNTCMTAWYPGSGLVVQDPLNSFLGKTDITLTNVNLWSVT